MRGTVGGHGLLGVGNCLWFAFGLIILAGRLWRAGGAEGFRRFRDLLQGPEPTNEAALDLLADITPQVAASIRTRPAFTGPLTG